MYSIILSLPVVVLTAYAAWTDYRRKEIDSWVPAAILTYGITVDAFLKPARFIESIVFMLTIFAVLIAIHIISKGDLDAGGLNLLSSLAFFFGSNVMPLLIIVGTITTACRIFKGIKNKTYFRTETIFALSIFVGTALTSLVNKF